MNNSIMKRVLVSVIILLFGSYGTNATVLQGGIGETAPKKTFCTVIDKHSKKPISNARITIPSKNFCTYSDINGHFELKSVISGQTILSVEKNNYKPFSMTIFKGAQNIPIVVEIETSSPFDIKVDTALCHLGDNNFSEASANAGQFRSSAVGPIYNKKFFIPTDTNNKDYYLVIGSIVGIDTALARGMGQNRISNAFASPPSVYLNGQKIAEIQINGDNQRIRLPQQFIKFNQQNKITIRAGRNLMQTAYVDYDDIEFMNLSIQSFNNTSKNKMGYYRD